MEWFHLRPKIWTRVSMSRLRMGLHQSKSNGSTTGEKDIYIKFYKYMYVSVNFIMAEQVSHCWMRQLKKVGRFESLLFLTSFFPSHPLTTANHRLSSSSWTLLPNATPTNLGDSAMSRSNYVDATDVVVHRLSLADRMRQISASLVTYASFHLSGVAVESYLLGQSYQKRPEPIALILIQS